MNMATALERLENMSEFYEPPPKQKTPPRRRSAQRPPPAVSGANSSRHRELTLDLRARVAGLHHEPCSWYSLDIGCRNLPVKSATGDCRIAGKGLPATDTSADIHVRCDALPSLDEEKFELSIGCTDLPEMVEGRTRLNVECNNLPAARDPRYVLEFVADVTPPDLIDGGNQDVLLVVRTADGSSKASFGSGSDEIGRTEVMKFVGARSSFVFQTPVAFDWRVPGQQIHIDAYFTDAEKAAQRNTPVDILLLAAVDSATPCLRSL